MYVKNKYAKRKSDKEWRENKIGELANNLDAHYEVLNKVKSPYFIPTKGQDYDPGNADAAQNKDIDCYPLVEKLIQDDFVKNTGKRRYIILGGSGMGKTMFSVSLIYSYISEYTENALQYPIYTFYLGNSANIEKIRKIANRDDAYKSILILDALDECKDAIKDIKGFMEKLEKVTDPFKVVLITSRQQLFPSDSDIPDKMIIPTPGGHLTFKHIFISPFDENDIQNYLVEKYKEAPHEMYCKTLEFMNRTDDLMARPLILSYIDDLMDLPEVKTLTNAEIYNAIIIKWLERENNVNPELEVKELFDISKEIAMCIYDNWREHGNLHISKEQFGDFAKEHGINENNFRGRSLVDRLGDGSIKFAHKSILEYFLAVVAIEQPWKSFDGETFEMARVFVGEISKLAIDGVTFGHINYYIPKYENKSIFSPDIKDIIENGNKKFDEATDDETKRRVYYKTINVIWKKLISRIEYYPFHERGSQLEMIHQFAKYSRVIQQEIKGDDFNIKRLERVIHEDRFTQKIKNGEFLKYVYYFQLFVCAIQEGFGFGKLDMQHHALNVMSEFCGFFNERFPSFRYTLVPKVIFPHMPMRSLHRNQNIMNVGCGFSGKVLQAFYVVKAQGLLTEEYACADPLPPYKVIRVFVEGSIDEIVNFIQTLRNMMYICLQKNIVYTVVHCVIDGKTIDYVIEKKCFEKKINDVGYTRGIISKMLETCLY